MICPHLIDPMSAFCRCALDPERDHCGRYSELWHGGGGPCHADLGPCNLDEIGRGEAWRAALAIFAPIAEYYGDWPFCVGSMLRSHGTAPMTIASDGDYALDAVGWSP